VNNIKLMLVGVDMWFFRTLLWHVWILLFMYCGCAMIYCVMWYCDAFVG
jgi:hypothetical protein